MSAKLHQHLQRFLSSIAATPSAPVYMWDDAEREPWAPLSGGLLASGLVALSPQAASHLTCPECSESAMVEGARLICVHCSLNRPALPEETLVYETDINRLAGFLCAGLQTRPDLKRLDGSNGFHVTTYNNNSERFHVFLFAGKEAELPNLLAAIQAQYKGQPCLVIALDDLRLEHAAGLCLIRMADIVRFTDDAPTISTEDFIAATQTIYAGVAGEAKRNHLRFRRKVRDMLQHQPDLATNENLTEIAQLQYGIGSTVAQSLITQERSPEQKKGGRPKKTSP